MGILHIIADRPGAGKTSLAAALLTHFREGGQRVAYYKPFSATPENDPDVAFVSQYLLTGAEAPQVPPPYRTPEAAAGEPVPTTSQGREIGSIEASLAAAADLVVVEGPDLVSAGGQPSALAQEVAELVDSRVVLLFRYARSLSADAVLRAAEPFGQRLAGVAINGVTLYRQRETQEKLVSELRAQSIPVLGVLPEDRAMLVVTVQQIADYLGARWVQEPVNTDAHIDRFLIGGNLMDSGVTYFGRYPNQAVITRSERPDIQMASLMTDTRCLILTGGSEPIEYVRVEALNRDVPLLVVPGDTLSTAETLGGLLEHANPYSLGKVRRFAQLVRQHLDLDALASAIG